VSGQRASPDEQQVNMVAILGMAWNDTAVTDAEPIELASRLR
jgi:hypothetical protein